MAGYNGLGVSKTAVIPKATGGVYTLKVDDVAGGEYTINEDILNKIVLCKTSVTEYYIAIFLTDIGVDGDFITFKNVEDQKNMYDLNLADTISTSDDSYLEFYGVGYSGDIFVPQIWGHFIEFNDTEITFVKEGAKWRRLASTGLSKLQSDPRPIIQQNALLFFNNRAIVFEGELAFQSGAKGNVFSRDNVLRIYQNYTSFEKPLQPYPSNSIDIGTLLLRFKTLFAQNGDFSGTVKAADPVNATDLVNKQYLEANIPASGISKLQDDLAPTLGGNLDAGLNNITNVEQLDVKTINLLTGFMSNLEMQFNNISNVEQLDVNTLQVLTGLMGNLDVAFNNLLNVEQLDVNTLNVLTGMLGNLNMQFNKITDLDTPIDPNDAATKQYVDDKPTGITKLLDDPSPKLSAILDCNYKKLINVQNPSSSFDAAHKGYVDAFKINSNSTDLGGSASYSIINGDWNTILVITNTIQSTLDITISPVMGNFVDIFNATEFDLTVSSSNGKAVKSLNNYIKIPKYGKATLKSAGGYYMLYGDLKA